MDIHSLHVREDHEQISAHRLSQFFPGQVLVSHWTGLALKGDEYEQFGEVTAWRVTLWEGTQLLGEQKSFLW